MRAPTDMPTPIQAAVMLNLLCGWGAANGMWRWKGWRFEFTAHAMLVRQWIALHPVRLTDTGRDALARWLLRGLR